MQVAGKLFFVAFKSRTKFITTIEMFLLDFQQLRNTRYIFIAFAPASFANFLKVK